MADGSEVPVRKLTHKQAVAALSRAEGLPALMRAVASLADDPRARPEELLTALDHPGVVAEQAAIALHRMMSIPWPRKRGPATSRAFWEKRLADPAQGRRSRGTYRSRMGIDPGGKTRASSA